MQQSVALLKITPRTEAARRRNVNAETNDSAQAVLNLEMERTVHLGLSENSVPLHPMVVLIIIPFLNCYFIGGIPHFQTLRIYVM